MVLPLVEQCSRVMIVSEPLLAGFHLAREYRADLRFPRATRLVTWFSFWCRQVAG